MSERKIRRRRKKLERRLGIRLDRDMSETEKVDFLEKRLKRAEKSYYFPKRNVLNHILPVADHDFRHFWALYEDSRECRYSMAEEIWRDARRYSKEIAVGVGAALVASAVFGLYVATEISSQRVQEHFAQAGYPMQTETAAAGGTGPDDPNTIEDELELAPYQTLLFHIGDTAVIFDGNLALPDGQPLLTMGLDATRYGLLHHLDDIDGFFNGKYADQGHAMPYDVGEAQRILADQGYRVDIGDGSIIQPAQQIVDLVNDKH